MPQKIRLTYYQDKGPVNLKSDLIEQIKGNVYINDIFDPYPSPFNVHLSCFLKALRLN